MTNNPDKNVSQILGSVDMKIVNIDDQISNLRKRIEALKNENQDLEPASDKEFDNPHGLRMPATEQIANNNDLIRKLENHILDLEKSKNPS